MTEYFHSSPQLYANARIVPQLHNDCFLANPFQFTIHPIMLCYIASILKESINNQQIERILISISVLPSIYIVKIYELILM